MKYASKFIYAMLIAQFVVVGSACNKNKQSNATGWKYNDPKWGGFERHKFKEQETGPGLIFVEGGTITLGSHEQDVTYDRNNLKRRVSIPSFYMDEHEVRNFDYLEYLYWLNRVHVSNPIVYEKALPDTLVWRNKLSYNEPHVLYYLRHPAYRDYPVVGVSWLQATAYAQWRTDRVNEMIMAREGLINLSVKQSVDDNNFNTEAYLLGLYSPDIKKELKDYAPDGKSRAVRVEDGILLPEYRLPTEAEWEYAAYSYISPEFNENVDVKRIYPWDGLTMRRNDTEKTRGNMYANYMRGRGDAAGVAGKLNDGFFYTAPVKNKEFLPNDFGLYHMAGNVSEWVMDVYRPLTWEDAEEINPFRGNVYRTKVTDADGLVEEKDTLGRIPYRDVDPTELKHGQRRKYQKADNIGFKDELKYNDIEQQYDLDATSLVNNIARVYKGGSWNDRAYWLTPGNRRFLDQDLGTATIGFRCVMDRLGDARKGHK